ncbi:MAG: hypothetical protein ACRCWG_04225 [Sarcina sp.]
MKNKKIKILVVASVIVIVSIAIVSFISTYSSNSKAQDKVVAADQKALNADLKAGNTSNATQDLNNLIADSNISKETANGYITQINNQVKKQQAIQAQAEAKEAQQEAQQAAKEQAQADATFIAQIKAGIVAMNKENSISPFEQVLNSTEPSNLSPSMQTTYNNYVAAENAMSTVCTAEQYLEAKDYTDAQSEMNGLDTSTLISSGLLTQSVINTMNAQIATGLAKQAANPQNTGGTGVYASNNPNNTSQYVNSLW